ncbi:Hypothetical predicted protein, partial [Podarcis lilfordi]
MRHRNMEKGNPLHPNQIDTDISIEGDQEVDKHDSGENKDSGCKGCFEKKYDSALHFFRKHKTRIRYVIYGILIAAYLAM